MRILLIGGGGHCLSCIDAIESEGKHVIQGVVERDGSSAREAWGYPVVGTDCDLPDLLSQSEAALVTVGQVTSPDVRRRLFDVICSTHVAPPAIVARTADVSPRAQVGIGSVILAGARVNAGGIVGENCIVNSQALVEHGAVIGPDSHVSTGTRINGDASIEHGCFIGSGAVIREGVRVGARSIIGAGRLVGEDVAAGTVLPARWDRATS